MSLIHKALQKAQEEKKNGEPSPAIHYGFYSSAKKLASKKISNKLAISIFIIFIIIFGSSLAFMYLKYSGHSLPVISKKEIPLQATPPPPINISDLAAEAQSAYSDGNYDLSIEKLKKILELEPNNINASNKIGLAYYKKDDLILAQSFFQKAITLDKTCAACYNNLGLIKMKENKNDEALTLFHEVIKLNKNYPDVYFNMGILSEKSGETSEAINYYTQFVFLSPDKESEIVKQVNQRIEQLLY